VTPAIAFTPAEQKIVITSALIMLIMGGGYMYCDSLETTPGINGSPPMTAQS